MIELRDDHLHIRFPEVHADARMSLHFQRTLRIPDDGKDYPLPAAWARFRCGTWTTSRRSCRIAGSNTAA